MLGMGMEGGGNQDVVCFLFVLLTCVAITRFCRKRLIFRTVSSFMLFRLFGLPLTLCFFR